MQRILLLCAFPPASWPLSSPLPYEASSLRMEDGATHPLVHSQVVVAGGGRQLPGCWWLPWGPQGYEHGGVGMASPQWGASAPQGLQGQRPPAEGASGAPRYHPASPSANQSSPGLHLLRPPSASHSPPPILFGHLTANLTWRQGEKQSGIFPASQSASGSPPAGSGEPRGIGRQGEGGRASLSQWDMWGRSP